MIELTDVTKRYGSTIAVDHLSFQVRPGEVTGFLGPNGSGKSTSARHLKGTIMNGTHDTHDTHDTETHMQAHHGSPRKPPAWFVHTAWRIHRGLYRLTGGRFLWTTTNKRGWGALLLTTTGRRSGQERKVIIGYLEDGPNLVAIAMNGWDEGHPDWWLNLQANPEATVRLADEDPQRAQAREASGEERARLWQRWLDADPALTAHASTRTTVTPVVILER